MYIHHPNGDNTTLIEVTMHPNEDIYMYMYTTLTSDDAHTPPIRRHTLPNFTGEMEITYMCVSNLNVQI